MEGKTSIKCPWCEKEGTPSTTKEKSNYGEILVRRCSGCGNIISSYLDEDRVVLEKVRTF